MIFGFPGERQRVAHQMSDALVFGWVITSRVRYAPAYPPSNALPYRHNAAIEHDGRPVDIRRIIAGQEDSRFAHVRRQAQPPHRRTGDFLYGALRFDKSLSSETFGDNDAWGNGVDADVVRPELRREGIRQLPQPTFA